MRKTIITESLINSYGTPAGAGYSWKRNTLKAFGVQWPPVKGWKDRIIGKEIDLDTLPQKANSIVSYNFFGYDDCGYKV